MSAEADRLTAGAQREANWQRWGPYLSERQWGTVREDYSADGDCWTYFPHDQARSRAYRWGEDGLLGWTDRECRLCFALALWNGQDPILQERLFGLTNTQGNHGEDVKECYYYLDATPTASYAKALYKYPQAAFPYDQLIRENAGRGRDVPEYELADTGVFDEGRYFDVQAEYAKAGPDDTLIRITVSNRGPEAAELTVLPTFWFRNTWSWGCAHEGCTMKPRLHHRADGSVEATHETLGSFHMVANAPDDGWIFTENESNGAALWGMDATSPHVKDSFHSYVIDGDRDAVRRSHGTKAAAVYRMQLAAGESRVLELRLSDDAAMPKAAFGEGFARVFAERLAEADAFYAPHEAQVSVAARPVLRQGYAGLVWGKQFYHYVVEDWLAGDPDQPPPPVSRKKGRNADWGHLFNRDVISMPDSWEYPWYAAWDLAFHMVPFAKIDPHFAKQQLTLFLREWYMHPNGQIPAYEFALGDVNPPVHAWAVWRVYKLSGPRGQRDRHFLASAFQKLLLNFTWWVNRKDTAGKHIFGGGFLGMDNIGVFDRSQPLPMGGRLEQADGTAWMASYCLTMLAIALELAPEDSEYEDMASKFFEHFVAISDAINSLGGTGLWDEADGFYYDQVWENYYAQPMRIRSFVGLVPLLAVEILEQETIDRLPGFRKRLNWFLENRQDLAKHIAYCDSVGGHGHRLLAIPSADRLRRVLGYLLDEHEFLSPHGIRSLSKHHEAHPFVLHVDGRDHKVGYSPGDSTTGLFGGNSNWRGPVWFPLNYLLIEALERYHHFYGDDFRVEFPTGSGRELSLREVASELSQRLAALFLPDADGRRPCHGDDPRHAADPHWRDLLLYHEFFHGDSGRGLGANHQTGWTALITQLLRKHGGTGDR